MTNEQAIAELQKEHDLIQGEHDLDGSQFAPALLEALAMAIEALKAQNMILYMNLPEVSVEEAIEILKRNSRLELILSDKDTNVPSNDTISRKQAIDVATSDGAYGCISAEELAKLPPTQPSLVKESRNLVKDLVNDCISRQAAIDAYGDWYVEEGTEDGFIGTVKQLLEGLPSAQPERKKGTYTVSGENAEWYCWYATCNECGKEWMGSRNFCPNCGKQMKRGEQDE